MVNTMSMNVRIVVCVVCIFIAQYSAAQSPPESTAVPTVQNITPFSLGDQYFGINAGGYFPLFLINPDINENADANQSIGGYGAFEWNIYLNEFFSIGAETAYLFSFTINRNTLSLWPTFVQFTFAPLIGQFLIPVHLDVGIVFAFLRDNVKADFALRGGVGFYWFFNPAWAVGINADYYFLPQIYDGDPAPRTDTRILNSLIASIGVIYKI